MQDHQLLLFLTSLAVLIGVASVMGAIANRLGGAPVVGEIIAGIVIGKTVLGRWCPDAFEVLFREPSVNTMLNGYKTLGIVLLLFVAGIEIDIAVLRRSSRALFFTSVLSAAVPFMVGYGIGVVIPEHYLVDPSQRTLHALFFGIALAISALPVITRTLIDFGLLKTEVGGLVLSSAVANDVVGWLCFGALSREMHAGGARGGSELVVSLAVPVLCLAVAILIVRPLADRWLQVAAFGRTVAPSSRALSMVMVMALLAASAAEHLGVHAVFGGFAVGLAIGGSTSLSPHTRQVLQDCVTNLFTPVFFAMMSLQYDFIAAFDPLLVLLVVSSACVSKIAGGALGARLGGVSGRAAWAIGFGLNSRGAMEILLAVIALDARIISEQMFVALVTMAIVTALISGPAMSRLLRHRRVESALVATTEPRVEGVS